MAKKAKKSASKEPAKTAVDYSALSDVELAKTVMPNWHHLTKILPAVQESDVGRLLKWELKTRKNKSVSIRLHQRLTRLRCVRERDEMLSKLDKKNAVSA